MSMSMQKPRDVPGVAIGQGYVSVCFSIARSGCFDWHVEIDGEHYSGVTPPAPARYLNGATLTDALLSVLYCLTLEAKPFPPIRHYLSFPFPVKRWAVLNHEEIKRVLHEEMEGEPDRTSPVTLMSVPVD